MSNDNKQQDNTVQEVLKIFENGWNKQVILYGPPGTSKTYSSTIIAAAFLLDVKTGENFEGVLKDKLKENGQSGDNLFEMAEAYLATQSNYKLVQFHPSYSYEDFVRGITVEPNGDKCISYEVQSKIIEKFCADNEDKKKVLVIDEINRAPLASVLGELIYGLEYRGNKVYTPYVLKQGEEEVALTIPDDLYIIGTMNTADRSIGSMDYAVRRRFAFIPVLSNSGVIEGSWHTKAVGEMALKLYEQLITKENNIFDSYRSDPELDVEDIKIGHTYFLGRGKGAEKEAEKAFLNYRIKYQIKPIYQEYIKDGLINGSGMKRFEEIVEEWEKGWSD